MALLDIVYNPLDASASGGTVLGWSGTVEEAVHPLGLSIYRFFTQNLRDMDAQEGAFFLKRYLQGPQQIWQGIHDSIVELATDMWDLSVVSPLRLRTMQRIVGWTPDLEWLTALLDDEGLRRLIGSSIPFWKIRGTETSIESVITLLLGARIRVWNYFDFRWVLEETDLGVEWDGLDPWAIEEDDTNTFNVRVVDAGINRELIKGLVKLARPSNERIEITYLTMLDLFNVPNDTAQWSVYKYPSNVVTPADVSSGRIRLGADDAETEMAWALPPIPRQFVAHGRFLRSEFAGLALCFNFDVDTEFGYMLAFDKSGGTVSLFNWTGPGLPAVLYSGAYTFDYDVYYNVRIEVTQDDPAAPTINYINAYVDGENILGASVPIADATHLNGGGLSMVKTWDAGNPTYIQCDAFEVFGLPIESDFIDINS